MDSHIRPDDAVAEARARWRPEVLPFLVEFARIPNQSPAYDPDWQAAGHMDRAADLMAAWASARSTSGCSKTAHE